MVIRAAAIDVEFHPLLLRRRGPVVSVVQRLHVEVGLDPGLLDGHRHLNRMASDSRNQAVCFGELDRLAEQVGPAGLDEAVADAALHVRPDGTFVDGLLYVRRQVIGLGVDLGDPLHPPAPLLPVSVEIVRRRRDDRVDPGFLAQLEGRHDPLLSGVGPEQLPQVRQVPAMRPAGKLVSADNQPADLQFANLARRQGQRRITYCHLSSSSQQISASTAPMSR